VCIKDERKMFYGQNSKGDFFDYIGRTVVDILMQEEAILTTG
jgi:hypothetical protein